MTISTTQSEVIFLGNGATSTFTFPFVWVSASDLIVTYTDTSGNATILSPSQYTLNLNPAAPGVTWGIGGTVTYPTVGSPIANGTQLSVSRVLDLTQETAISGQGNFSPTVVESALDIQCMQTQQVSARTGSLRGYWATGILYNFGDIVQDGPNGTNSLNLYTCVNAGTSTTWAADLADGVWSLTFNMANFLSNVGTMPAYTVLGNSTASPLAPAFTNSPHVSGTMTADGTITSASTVQGTRLISTVATGTPPMTVASTTAVTNLRPDLSLVNSWTGQQNTLVAALTDNPTTTWDLNTQQNAKLTINGNRTLANPTNMLDGGCYILRITQGAGGSHTLAYGGAYKFPGGVKPVLSTAAGAIDILTFSSDGTSMYGSIQKAFS